ncbi:MAG TPA: alpha-amylase family glycosyl hydrolase [Ktedonobacterales bacterium]
MSRPSVALPRWRQVAQSRAFLIVCLIVVVIAVALAAIAPRLAGPGARGGAQAYCAAPRASLPRGSGDFKTGFIYQVMLDRFFDGDHANDNPQSAPGLYDSTHQNWKLYWGGDLKGLTEKIPYIAGMGATAVWISPPVENVSTGLDYGDGNGPQAGYHGYWAIDDYRIDPHLGTWADFDTFIATAHRAGVKVMVDFPANDSNPREIGQSGAIYKDGVLEASYNNDPAGWYHRDPSISSFTDMYDLEYGTLADLADFAQENPAVDAYLKGAIAQFIAHGVDGIRFDAAKHIPGPTGGWLRTVADSIEATGPHYLTGEWQVTDPTDLTYPSAVRFANNSGISLLNFSVMNALDDAYARGSLSGAVEVDSVLRTEARDLTWPNDQANFIDNHDFQRFLSLDNNHTDLHAALAALMTIPGAPVIYYGTEQYLHNDTQGGGDPYNRPMMASFDTTTPAYRLISCLSALRQSNPALPYGSYAPLKVTRSVFTFQRQFGASVVVVAINDGASDKTLNQVTTALPAGTYHDYLDGKFHGATLTVGAGGVTHALALPAGSVAIWQYTTASSSTPRIGGIGPELARAGETIAIDGQGFAASDTVKIGQYQAQITAATADSITAKVPDMPGGAYQAQVCAGTVCSPGYALNVASGPQMPVNITVIGLPGLAPAQQLYITGDAPELGGGSTATSAALGPMLSPATASVSRFLLVSLPACKTLSIAFEAVDLSGNVLSEGTTHTLTIPCQGEGAATFTWGR